MDGYSQSRSMAFTQDVQETWPLPNLLPVHLWQSPKCPQPLAITQASPCACCGHPGAHSLGSPSAHGNHPGSSAEASSCGIHSGWGCPKTDTGDSIASRGAPSAGGAIEGRAANSVIDICWRLLKTTVSGDDLRLDSCCAFFRRRKVSYGGR